MTALYVIAAEYRALADALADLDLDPQTVADTLEGAAGELEIKAEAVACMVRNIEVTADAIKAHCEMQRERESVIRRRADHLRDYLTRTLSACGIQKIERPGLTIGWRKSSAVAIDEPALIPAEFWRQSPAPPPEPDKTALAAALKTGAEIPGAHLEHRSNLTIK